MHWQNETVPGQRFKTFTGWTAQIIQHEIDHCEGITHMKKCRITVMRITRYDDLIEQYENPIEHACDMEVGQVFIANGWEKPEGFCQSAWDTLSPFVLALSHGGRGLLRRLDEKSPVRHALLQRWIPPGELPGGSPGRGRRLTSPFSPPDRIKSRSIWFLPDAPAFFVHSGELLQLPFNQRNRKAKGLDRRRFARVIWDLYRLGFSFPSSVLTAFPQLVQGGVNLPFGLLRLVFFGVGHFCPSLCRSFAPVPPHPEAAPAAADSPGLAAARQG